MLPANTYVVSYADTAWGHVGYVYQATNFIYTGCTSERTDKVGQFGGHSRHYNKNETRRQFRSAKHRYIYLVGSKTDRKRMMSELRYGIMPYPKGDSIHYDVNDPKRVTEATYDA